MIQKPYFAEHQIITSQYTDGTEYILEDGTEYIGLYHILPTGQRFTEVTQTDKSVILLPKRLELSESARTYNKNTSFKTFNYILPEPYFPLVTLRNYQEGSFQRYFIQKRNNPIGTVMEIDADQFLSINTINQVGINGNIYNKCELTWRVNGPDVEKWNKYSVSLAERNFPFLKTYLTNYLEFSM